MLLRFMPLARTPMDKKSGNGMQSYHRSMEKMLDSLTPWTRAQHNRLAGLRETLKPGEAVIVLGEGESAKDFPVFDDMKVIRE